MTVIYYVLCAAIGFLGGMFVTARAIADAMEEMDQTDGVSPIGKNTNQQRRMDK